MMEDTSPTKSYEVIEDEMIDHREASLLIGLKYITKTDQRNYPILLKVCKNLGYDSYVPVLEELNESWEFFQRCM